MPNLTGSTAFFGIRKTSGSLGALHIGDKSGTQYEILTGSTGGATLKNITTIDASGLASLDGGIDVNGSAFVVSTAGAVSAARLDNNNGGITNAGAVSGVTTIDGSGDLTMGTITMTGFSVDSDGDLTARTGSLSGDLTVAGNLTVNGTTTTINSTTISVDDKNIELGSTATPSDASANGGGITLKGDANYTITWDSSNASWDFNQHVNLNSTSEEFKIADSSVLSSDTLGSGVVNSSLTSVGALNGGSITSGFGNIDIGESTLNAGSSTFTTLSGSGAAEFASMHSDSVNIDGGAIDGTAIGASSRSTGAFTTLSGSGAAEFASMHSDSVNIDGGAIDGTAIGANSASTGAFTALSASAALVMDGVSLTAVVTEDEGINSSDNDTSFPTTAAVKDYVDSVASSGFTLSDGVNSETIGNGNTLTVNGTSNEVDVAVSATDTLTIGLPNDVTIGNDLTVTNDLTVGGGDIDITSNSDTGRIQLDGTTVLTLSGSDVTAANDLTVSQDLTVSNAMSVAGNASFNGNVALGDNGESDTITATARFASDLIPSSDSMRSLGSELLQWANIHADAGNIDSVIATSVTDGTATLTGGALTGLTTLGAADAPVSNLYATNVITGDFHMKNERGDWTLFEESDHIRIRNNATGQVFKMGMTLIEE